MFVELIATGTEIVRGRSPDTNTPHIARRLAEAGLDVRFFTTCGDDPRDLAAAFRQAIRRADLTIVTGGLGPTQDDITRPAAAEATRRPLIFVRAEWRRLQERAAALGRRLASNNRSQAWFPRGAEILPNSVGWAAGFLVELRGGRRLVALPGPPREMAPMLDTLLARLGPPPADRVDKAFKIFGVPESDVEARILADLRKLRGVDYGITAKGWTISLNLRIRGRGDPESAVERIRSLLRRRFGDAFYGEDDCTLAGATAALLLSRRATLAVAESCTGGLVADRLTDVPGISDSLLESLVVYSNESKRSRLGVRTATLARHGAVSRQTAAEMARGARKSAGADLGLSTTGIAGPGGGTADKPVGLVYFGLADAKTVRVERRVFGGTRRDVKERAADFALDLARRTLLDGGRR
jgi:nicotinamide-nucleotide amidase